MNEAVGVVTCEGFGSDDASAGAEGGCWGYRPAEGGFVLIECDVDYIISYHIMSCQIMERKGSCRFCIVLKAYISKLYIWSQETDRKEFGPTKYLGLPVPSVGKWSVVHSTFKPTTT